MWIHLLLAVPKDFVIAGCYVTCWVKTIDEQARKLHCVRSVRCWPTNTWGSYFILSNWV